MSRLDDNNRRGHRSPEPQPWQLVLEHVIRWPGARQVDLQRYVADPSRVCRVLYRSGVIERAVAYIDGRSWLMWYPAGEAPRTMTIIQRVVATIERFPGATIGDISAWLRSDGITHGNVAVALQGVAHNKLAEHRGWRPSRWYPRAR